MSNGVRWRVWEAHCIKCKRAAIGLAAGAESAQAALELKEMGWRDLKGWHCPGCAPLAAKPEGE